MGDSLISVGNIFGGISLYTIDRTIISLLTSLCTFICTITC